MIFRNLDETGDWQWGKGRSDYVDKDRAIALNIRTRILSWVGDCFFDLNSGIDWVNRLGSKNQRILLETDLRRIVLQSEGVTGITEFYTNLIDRSFTASYAVSTIYSKEFRDTLNREI